MNKKYKIITLLTLVFGVVATSILTTATGAQISEYERESRSAVNESAALKEAISAKSAITQVSQKIDSLNFKQAQTIYVSGTTPLALK